MIRFFILSALIPLFLISIASQAENIASYKGELTLIYNGAPIVFKNLPTFEEFPAEAPADQTADDIDWTSKKSAWNFRTRLRKALKSGANFNGHYAVMTHGCGSSCQVHWIIDIRNGKIVGTFGTSAGTDYRLDSSLIIAEAIPDGATWVEGYGNITKLRYYTVENGTFREVKILDLSEMWARDAPGGL